MCFIGCETVILNGLVIDMKSDVGNNIAEYRKRYKLSQAELAQAIGVSRKTISTIETERFTPSVTIALRIAKQFGVPVEALFKLKSVED